MNIVQTHKFGGHGRRVAVIGSGISGASAAWALSGTHDVTLFEAEDRAGGHTATVDIDYDGTPVSVDTGFIVFNAHNYPNLQALFAHLDVATTQSNMGFSLSLDDGRLEWCGSTYRAIFAQKRNVLSVPFLWMLREIGRFNTQCLADRDAGRLSGLSIGQYLEKRRFSESFRNNYLIPMAAAIWSTPRIKMLDFPAETFISFFENHRLIHNERPMWRTVTGGARNYLEKLLAPIGNGLRLSAPVNAISRDPFGVTLQAGCAAPERFDHLVIASHSDQALAMLDDASAAEKEVLGAISYKPNRVVLHRDERLMPKRKRAWTAWNYLRSEDDGEHAGVSVTYWMNKLQGIDMTRPLFVSLNPMREPHPEKTFGEWNFTHPQFDAAAIEAQRRLPEIQGVRRTWFAGAWTGCGFHEDGLSSGLAAAEALGASIPWRTGQVPHSETLIAAE